MPRTIVSALSLFLGVATQAQKPPTESAVDWRAFNAPPAPALTPDEALKSFRLPPGFRIELVAAEPLIEDPVVASWDADGRLWVAEMRAYMHDTEGVGENRGIDRVVVLEDKDGDGRMDKSTVFLDGLVMPRSIAHVRGGVLIAEPPKIWYCRDTDGDLVCDEKTEVNDSYGQRDAVSRTASGLVRAIDNRLYSSRHPVRFHFRDGRLIAEPDAYRGDYGVAQDDFGRIYANVNSSWLHADLLHPSYLLRHPELQSGVGVYEKLVRDQSVHSIRVNPGVNQGFMKGILRPDGRLAKTTAATWPGIYRGDQFPDEFQGNAFIPEPAGNVVARIALTREGIRPEPTRKLTPDPDWQQRDFLVSTDERFRPVHCDNGPDGCLYVVDFYRGILEYKLFVTPFLAEQIADRQLDRPLGLGRIYRIVHESRPRKTPVQLSRASTRQLIELLSHTSGWQRDTAQRLLVERNDPGSVAPLKQLVRGGDSALRRLHALWTLEGMERADGETIHAAKNDSHARVREAAVRIGDTAGDDSTYLQQLLKLTRDPAPEVRLQVMQSLGNFSDRKEVRGAMIELLASKEEPALFRQAAASGLAGRELDFLRQLLPQPAAASHASLIRELAALVFRGRQAERIQTLLALAAETRQQAPIQEALLDGMTRAFRKPSPVMLPAEPAALTVLKKQSRGRAATLTAKLRALLTWPGDTSRKNTAAVRPLTAAEQARFDRGRPLYRETCMPCHQIHGRGMASLAPPLTGSPWVLGDPQRLIRVVLHGLSGPLKIQGKDWNLIMPGQFVNPRMTDENLAAVLTYIRREWDHTADPIEAKTVKDLRAQHRQRVLPWTVPEITKLHPSVP